MKITEMKMTIVQDADHCDSDNIGGCQHMVLGTDDAGGGIFYYLETERWAFDSVEQLVKNLKKAVEALSPTESMFDDNEEEEK